MLLKKDMLKRSTENKGKKLQLEIVGECLVCTSHTPNKDGYIRIYAGKGEYPRMQFLHRLVWKNHNGEIPEGYEVDHKCRNRSCSNIDHLQLLNKSEHKVKTNKERYSERIQNVVNLIKQGYSTVHIMKTCNVTREYVNRHKRNIKHEQS